ncbi:MAG: Mth938-like domain-containing protein [Gammaproteobacteria bacterium]|nr:Mth938-like domain-containing protein [Gammaproteobacteria bacterium]MDH3465900.1 Mth938-like domain-containing protein [Gammaproteobacteria bacterium]
MKFHLADTSRINIIRSYTDHEVIVNDRRYVASLVVSANSIIDDWTPRRFDDLCEADFVELGALEPELVILGTGTRLRFPDPRLTLGLSSKRIGIEVMDSRAACRTYNILVAEGRHVMAAILIEHPEDTAPD